MRAPQVEKKAASGLSGRNMKESTLATRIGVSVIIPESERYERSDESVSTVSGSRNNWIKKQISSASIPFFTGKAKNTNERMNARSSEGFGPIIMMYSSRKERDISFA